MGPVRLKEVQRDPVTKDIIHVDIQVVNEEQKVKAYVPIRIQDNYEASRRGIVIQRQRDTVLVEGLPNIFHLRLMLLSGLLSRGKHTDRDLKYRKN